MLSVGPVPESKEKIADTFETVLAMYVIVSGADWPAGMNREFVIWKSMLVGDIGPVMLLVSSGD